MATETMEGVFNVLVKSLSLTIGLGMITGGEVGCGSKGLAQLFPDGGGELRATIGYDLCGDSLDAEDVGDEELNSSCSRVQLGKSNKVTGL